MNLPFLRAVILLAIPFGVLVGAAAQPDRHLNSSEDSSRIAFDAATVRPAKSGSRIQSLIPLNHGTAYRVTGGHFKATNALRAYIEFAYDLKPFQCISILKQAPRWVSEDLFDIDARSDRPNVTKEDMRKMTQSLLADRFHLQIRKQMQPSQVFLLVLSKPGVPGPQLKPVEEKQAGRPAPDLDGIFLDLKPSCSACRRVGGRDVLLGQLASFLSDLQPPGLPVIDGTGLSGRYDFSLEWTPHPGEISFPGAARAVPVSTSATQQSDSDFFRQISSAPSQPNLEGSLKTQLGLKLRKQMGQAEFYIVDHVERPRPN